MQRTKDMRENRRFKRIFTYVLKNLSVFTNENTPNGKFAPLSR